MNRFATPAQLRASFIRWAAVLAPLALLLGTLSGYAAGSAANGPWFAALNKPALYPPPVLFPTVWSLLYPMMGLALALVIAARRSALKGWAVFACLLQFALNLTWSPVFFAAHAIGWALLVVLALDLSLIATIALFGRIDRRAAWLLAPYLAWTLFATGLNWQLFHDNPPASLATPPAAVQPPAA